MLGTFAFIARAVGFSFLLPLYSKASGLSTEEYGFLFALQNLTPIVALVPVLALARRGWDRRLMMIGPSLGLLGMVTLIAAREREDRGGARLYEARERRQAAITGTTGKGGAEEEGKGGEGPSSQDAQ